MSGSILSRILGAFEGFRGKVDGGDRVATRILFAVFVLLLTTLYVSGMKIITMEPAGMLGTGSRSDFDDYYQASIRLRTGGDLYNLQRLEAGREAAAAGSLDPSLVQGVGSYLYPPLTAWLLTPLSYLEYEPAAFAYQTLSLLALCGFFYFIYWRLRAREVGTRIGPVAFVALCASLLLFQFLLGNADNGNIGFFLILLGGAGVVLAFASRDLAQFVGGFCLGIATCIKITPVFLVLPLVAGGRVVAVLGMGAGGVAGLVLPALTLGFVENLALLQDWYGFLIGNFQKYSIVRPWANNQTISAAVGKFLLVGADLRQGDYGLPLFFRALPDAETRALIIGGVRGANMALYLLGLLTALRLFLMGSRRPGSPFVDERTVRMLMLASLISLVASGVSWFHAYCVLLVPVLLRLYLHWYGRRPLERGEVLALAGIGIFGVGTTSLGPFLREALAMYSVFVLIALAVTVYMAVLLWLRPAGSADDGRAENARAGSN